LQPFAIVCVSFQLQLPNSIENMPYLCLQSTA